MINIKRVSFNAWRINYLQRNFINIIYITENKNKLLKNYKWSDTVYIPCNINTIYHNILLHPYADKTRRTLLISEKII